MEEVYIEVSDVHVDLSATDKKGFWTIEDSLWGDLDRKFARAIPVNKSVIVSGLKEVQKEKVDLYEYLIDADFILEEEQRIREQISDKIGIPQERVTVMVMLSGIRYKGKRANIYEDEQIAKLLMGEKV